MRLETVDRLDEAKHRLETVDMRLSIGLMSLSNPDAS
jgi:hypothetical protein